MSFKDNWDNLAATVATSKKGDGSETTGVTFVVSVAGGTSWVSGRTGATQTTDLTHQDVTGNQQTGKSAKFPGAAGHAEMAALYFLLSIYCLNANGSPDPALFNNLGNLRVDCNAKPICCRCAAVLGFLGFSALNGNTLKCKDPMGSTEWGASQRVKTFLDAKGFGSIEDLARWGGV